ncbi:MULTISPECIES: hypothetical protein [Actinomycetes]|uniref:DUF222 domain-containing protein n=1 Tax=Nocardia testacea TaxID=248551 RepID=A0ABW7W990_9NOCA
MKRRQVRHDPVAGRAVDRVDAGKFDQALTRLMDEVVLVEKDIWCRMGRGEPLDSVGESIGLSGRHALLMWLVAKDRIYLHAAKQGSLVEPADSTVDTRQADYGFDTELATLENALFLRLLSGELIGVVAKSVDVGTPELKIWYSAKLAMLKLAAPNADISQYEDEVGTDDFHRMVKHFGQFARQPSDQKPLINCQDHGRSVAVGKPRCECCPCELPTSSTDKGGTRGSGPKRKTCSPTCRKRKSRQTKKAASQHLRHNRMPFPPE